MKHTRTPDRTSQSVSERMRLDKWLWAARFYKTRSLASEAIEKGRVLLSGQPTKPSKEIKPGDELKMRIGVVDRTVVVRGISGQRGSAPVAALLYDETEDSVAERLRQAEQRRLAPEPAHTLTQGRPTKRDRRDADRLRGQASSDEDRSDWGSRWSASLDD